MTKIAGSGSGSISQRHGSADPDPLQNVMDPEHWIKFSNSCESVVEAVRVLYSHSLFGNPYDLYGNSHGLY